MSDASPLSDPRSDPAAAARAALDALLAEYPDDAAMAASMLADFAATSAALAPFAARDKAVIFGSARIAEDSPIYAATRQLAALLAHEGFVVVTGGGPGVMTAGLEGAGAGNAIGIAIQLPFESPARVLQVPVVLQQRFFTRKLALLRKTRAVVVLPGGFGTLDETFEVLTLLQTGKKSPSPVVLFDPLGNGFFDPLLQMVQKATAAGFVAEQDSFLLHCADSVEDVVSHIRKFWANYVRFEAADGIAHIELRRPLAPSRLALLDEAFTPFAPFSAASTNPSTDPTAIPSATLVTDVPAPQPTHTQLRFRFDRRNYGLLRRLIDALNNPY